MQPFSCPKQIDQIVLGLVGVGYNAGVCVCVCACGGGGGGGGQLSGFGVLSVWPTIFPYCALMVVRSFTHGLHSPLLPSVFCCNRAAMPEEKPWYLVYMRQGTLTAADEDGSKVSRGEPESPRGISVVASKSLRPGETNIGRSG